MIDPYAVFGVSKNATIDEIKKAYRKLAKKLHPDLNPGKNSERKFKDIAHAYELIGSAEAKAFYDQGETEEQRQQQYEEMMRKGQNSKRDQYYYNRQRDNGGYASMFGKDFDTHDTEDIFAQFFSDRTSHSKRRSVHGSDESYQMDIELKEAALGSEKIITLSNGKALQVKIPAGIEDGQKLKFKGQGAAGIENVPPGDAYVQINIKPMPGFKREGKDIITELPISLFEAISGAQIEVPTIDGYVILSIPPGVSTGTKLRIKGKGIGSENNRGNQIVTINIAMPKKIDPAFRHAIQNLSKEFSYGARSPR